MINRAFPPPHTQKKSLIFPTANRCWLVVQRYILSYWVFILGHMKVV